MNLDDELRSALGRREPPLGFAQRVLARAQDSRERRRSWIEPLALLWPRRLRWAAACLFACVLLVTAGLEHRRRSQGELAKQQVVLALRIASAKLSYAQEKAQEIGFPRARTRSRTGAGTYPELESQ